MTKSSCILRLTSHPISEHAPLGLQFQLPFVAPVLRQRPPKDMDAGPKHAPKFGNDQNRGFKLKVFGMSVVFCLLCFLTTIETKTAFASSIRILQVCRLLVDPICIYLFHQFWLFFGTSTVFILGESGTLMVSSNMRCDASNPSEHLFSLSTLGQLFHKTSLLYHHLVSFESLLPHHFTLVFSVMSCLVSPSCITASQQLI